MNPILCAPQSNENQLQELEFTSLMQENKKLRSKLLELERGEEDLNLKAQQLWSGLGDLESEYMGMLVELGVIQRLKTQEIQWMSLSSSFFASREHDVL
ncbi:protein MICRORCHIDIA 6-like [Rhododendron vialii]|uniref:protein MICRORCHIDIA 6-like n=1 Tax=Rhododendron vialii TaxID=182163 RepID=UPI00265D9CD5|nr:protein MICRORCHIDIA 6-like [Rhododendron vialii]